MLTQPRGSAHSKAFAAQTHEPVGLYPQKIFNESNRGRVLRFSYFKREKVSVWELSDVRVLRSQNTDCRKNDSFSTGSVRTQVVGKTKFVDRLDRLLAIFMSA